MSLTAINLRSGFMREFGKFPIFPIIGLTLTKVLLSHAQKKKFFDTFVARSVLYNSVNLLSSTAYSRTNVICNVTCGEAGCGSGNLRCFSPVVCCDVEDIPCTTDAGFLLDVGIIYP